MTVLMKKVNFILDIFVKELGSAYIAKSFGPTYIAALLVQQF